nr:hypothetical protein [Tanacetum cinerariifolium]
HTYKARLVAKGCTQTYKIEYEETFFPVADIRAIRILIAIAAYYDYEIWQMDVKTAFLNGRLDEDIYMEQPEGGGLHEESALCFGCRIYQTGYIFVVNGGAVDWKSKKQTTIAMHSAQAEYVAASKAAMEAVWIRIFVGDLGVMPSINKHINMYCDNSTAIIFANEPRIMKGARHFLRRYHYVREQVETGEIKLIKRGAKRYHRRYHYVRESIALGEIRFLKVHIDENLADPFTKALSKGKLTQHARIMGLRLASSFIPKAWISWINYCNKLSGINQLCSTQLCYVVDTTFHCWFRRWWRTRLHYMVYGVRSNFDKRDLDDCFLCFLFNWNKRRSLTCLGNYGTVWMEGGAELNKRPLPGGRLIYTHTDESTHNVQPSINTPSAPPMIGEVSRLNESKESTFGTKKAEGKGTLGEGVQNEREVVTSEEDEIKDVTLDMDKTVADEIQIDEEHHTLKKDDPVDRAGPKVKQGNPDNEKEDETNKNTKLITRHNNTHKFLDITSMELPGLFLAYWTMETLREKDYPTQLRTLGVGVAIVVGRVRSIVLPWVGEGMISDDGNKTPAMVTFAFRITRADGQHRGIKYWTGPGFVEGKSMVSLRERLD